MVQYELGSVELLPYLSKSLQRFMKKRNIKRTSADLTIKLLHDLVKFQQQPATIRTLLKTFKGDLNREAANSTEVILIETLLLKYWGESKLEK